MEGKPTGFLTDTQQMMYAFGDFRRPSLETAAIAESFVLSQLRSIIYAAAEVAAYRNSKILTIEDIIFLMRNNPIKIQRLIKHLKTKDIRNEAKLAEKGELQLEKLKSSTQRCREYIERIDETGKLIAACDEEYFDEIHLERLIRYDKVTRSMDEKRYLEFCKVRQVSFRGKYSPAFQSSLQETVDSLQLKLEKLTNDVLCYLAYETLGQLIDLCLLIRRDASASFNDCVSRLMSVQSVNPLYPHVSLPIREKVDPGRKCEFAGHPISPAEIREVMRRLQEPGSTSTGWATSGRGARGWGGGFSTPEHNIKLLAI